MADKAGVVQLNVAFLLSSAKLATSLRMMGLAERNLKRDEEAEETLVHAISVFKGSRIKTCLQKLYAETDDTMDSGETPFPPFVPFTLPAAPILSYCMNPRPPDALTHHDLILPDLPTHRPSAPCWRPRLI